MFQDLDENVAGTVRMANNSVSEVKGIGSVKLIRSDGSEAILTKVRYIPGVRRNLISLGSLESSGCTYSSEGGVMKILKDGRVVLEAERHDTLYFLKEGACSEGEVSHLANETDDTRLWHSRLAHISEKNLMMLAQRDLLDKSKISSLKFCEDCVLGKSHRQPFKKSKHTTRGILDYIHMDLWGSPHVPKSMGGCQYFLSIIDDFSRKLWVFFLKTKDEAASKFRTWLAMVENQTQRKVKRIRSDNGLEFINKSFQDLCRENGIIHHRTVAYTPQQNGVAERMNRSIMDKVRCMLNESGLPKVFWAEAVSTAVHVINKTPSSAVKFQIPDEIWFGSKPGYSYLRRFGCIAYAHSDDGKLNARAKKGVFLSYPEGVKGYKIWLLEAEKCIISRNVVFKETEMYKDAKETSDTVDETEVEAVEFELPHQSKESTSAPEQDEDVDSEEEEESPHLADYHLARDRVRREIRIPVRFREDQGISHCFLATEEGNLSEPESYSEAIKDSSWRDWKLAMDDEIESMRKNQTWVLVQKPAKAKVIGNRWVYRRKEGIEGVEKPRHKARLVAKGFSQREGIDYNDIFAPVVKHVSIRILLSIVAEKDLELEQLDVKTAFLHGTLDEVIYMEQPQGYIEKGEEDLVCLLKRSIYGLKQSPRQWNRRFNEFMMSQDFIRSNRDSCVYVKKLGEGSFIYLLLYVDDMLVASDNKREIQKLKEKLNSEFEMKDLGPAKKILGMQIKRDRVAGRLELTQEAYTEKILRIFKCDQAKAVRTPLGKHFKLKAATEDELRAQSGKMQYVPYPNAVGSIMYLMIGTRPDLAYSLGVVSRFMANPLEDHWDAVKWIFKYLKGSVSGKLVFQRSGNMNLCGYCDSDYASDLDKRRSISGFVFSFGGTAVSWKSNLQRVVALSTTEAEYMSLTESVKEANWLRGLVSDFGYEQKSVEIFCDSQSAIALSKNNVHHERTKHIETKFHFIRDQIECGCIEVSKISTAENPADMLTKVLPVEKMTEALRKLQVSLN